MRARRVAAAVAAGALVVLAGLIGGASVARADSGVWGPSQIPYSNGVVCQVGAGATALVSWPNSSTSAPGFASSPVTGPADGAPGAYGTPATTPTSTGPAPIAIEQQRALAVLLSYFGESGDAATVANVAALISNDTSCFGAGIPGVDAAAAQALRSQAESFAGPYTVTVGSDGTLIPGTPGSVHADVRSASGTPLSGVAVSFSADGTSLTADGRTDDGGRARVDVQVPEGWTSDKLVVHAKISLPTTVVQLSAPGTIPLLAAATPEDASGQAAVPVDTTADPVVQVGTAPALVLPGMSAAAQLSIGGMRGHSGRATVTSIGPLDFRAGTGCSSYQRADWEKGTSHTVAQGVAFTGDGTVPVPLTTLVATKGCYLLQARVDTTNATPAATANSDPGDSASVLGVAPVQVAASPAHQGLALRGPLAATVRVSGDVPAQLSGTSGTLLGPRLADRGRCPADGWKSAPTAGTLTVKADGDAATEAQLTSTDVDRDGCYLFRLTTTVELPGTGSIALGDVTTRALVLAPQLSVTFLSTHGVTVGGQVRATVAVTGTLQHKGSLSLRLARLADDTQGCFGRDYRQATPVSGTDAPETTTTGDGSFVVTTPKIPSTGCWTVLPSLTLADDSALRLDASAPALSTVAFTAVQPQHNVDLRGESRTVDQTARYVIAGIVAGVLVLGALVATVRVAFATSDDD